VSISLTFVYSPVWLLLSEHLEEDLQAFWQFYRDLNYYVAHVSLTNDLEVVPALYRSDTGLGECHQRSNMQETAFCLSAKPITLVIAHLECKLSYPCNHSLQSPDGHVKNVKIVSSDSSWPGSRQTPSQRKAVIVLPEVSTWLHDHDLLSFISNQLSVTFVT
jgi:hypothetical protein